MEADLGELLASLEALATESLAHDIGWRFLKLGRRIERAGHLLFLARALLLPGWEEGEPPPAPTEFRLQTLLHFTENLFTYRGVYHGIYHPASILAWLLGAPENPRGLRFQADAIAEHLGALPEDLAPRAVSALRGTAFRLVSAAKLLDPAGLARDPARAGAFFAETRRDRRGIERSPDPDLFQPHGGSGPPERRNGLKRAAHAPLPRHPRHALCARLHGDDRLAAPAPAAQHEAAQHCDAFELKISPHPADLAARVDYFGNKQHIFTLHEAHAELRITTRSLVRREEPVLPMPGLTPPVADLRSLVDAAVAAGEFQLEQFRHASPLVPLLPAARSLVAGLTADLDPGRTPAMAWLAVLGTRFCEAFIFDPGGDAHLDSAWPRSW